MAKTTIQEDTPKDRLCPYNLVFKAQLLFYIPTIHDTNRAISLLNLHNIKVVVRLTKAHTQLLQKIQIHTLV